MHVLDLKTYLKATRLLSCVVGVVRVEIIERHNFVSYLLVQ